jgi:flavin reductase (DIM6/NTAB) family NADH-FMN oxidoreductase RutF
VLVGTLEVDGSADLAPKHMAMPLGWQNWFCFVCSPRHATQRNAERTGQFTVSFPRPEQLLETSFAAAPRSEDSSKPGLAALETVAARRVDGVLLAGTSTWLECELDRIVAGFGDNTLIVGRVVAVAVEEGALREPDRDDGGARPRPPAARLPRPGRFAAVADSLSFPFPADFRR